MSNLINKSKKLSYFLRHKPEDASLTIDKNGWVLISQLLENTDFSEKEINDIVETNNKQRFEFNEDSTKIRARQGHSIDLELGYKPSLPPKFLYHGTSIKCYENKIIQEGIKKMNRQHVHLSSDDITARNVGKRHGKPIVLVINAGQMQEDGYIFYHTENNVWLTDFISNKYIVGQT